MTLGTGKFLKSSAVSSSEKLLGIEILLMLRLGNLFVWHMDLLSGGVSEKDFFVALTDNQPVMTRPSSISKLVVRNAWSTFRLSVTISSITDLPFFDSIQLWSNGFP